MTCELTNGDYNNTVYAEENRQLFHNNHVFVVNMIGSKGAGKTTLLVKLLKYLQKHLNAAVIEADLSRAKDADKIASCNIPMIQINTEMSGQLNAKMINQVLPGFYLEDLDLIVIENMGNITSPSTYELGEDVTLLVMSIAECVENPKINPDVLTASEALIINKTDLLEMININIPKIISGLSAIKPDLKVFETCCHEGEVSGVEEFGKWLIEQIKNKTKR